MKQIRTWAWANKPQNKDEWKTYSPVYPNMEIISLIPEKSEKIHVIGEITKYVLEKVSECELTVHEVRYLLNRISDCVMDNAVYKPIFTDDNED